MKTGQAAIIASAAVALLACGSSAEREVGVAENAVGTIYKVGPSRPLKTLSAVVNLLGPGDVVELDGNATYSGGIVLDAAGTATSRITIRGIAVAGKRPIISGGYNGIELAGNHTTLEGVEVTGSSARCVFHHAHDIIIRDSVVRDCPAHGILGADSDSGSLTLDHVEVYGCGAGTTKHPVYIATDEEAYPGSVFRMQHSYVHHANGGNAVKTRAERNEIYYNWIEGGLYKDLELIGPDGQDEDLAREDSDVVGNVFKKTHTQYVVRVGGDGTGQTHGRYRFVNNTFLLMQGSAAAIHAFDGVESIELHNNVFHRIGGGSVQILRDDASWATGSPIVTGSRNAVPSGSSYPGAWQNTLVANSPGFADLAGNDVSLLSTSVLVNAGNGAPTSPTGKAFPSPLALPAFLPPTADLAGQLSVVARPVVGTIDIGATEFCSGASCGGGSPPPPEPPPEEPPPASCKVGAPNAWLTTPFAKKSGAFTAKWNVTPSSSVVDGAVALSLGAQTTWNGLAAIVRFAPSGTIDVRDGIYYDADVDISYVAGATYGIRVVVDVPTHRYSVYVKAPGQSEVRIADQYAFRSQQASVTGLDTWVVNQLESGDTLSACDFTVE